MYSSTSRSSWPTRLKIVPPQPGQVQAGSWVMVSRGRCAGNLARRLRGLGPAVGGGLVVCRVFQLAGSVTPARAAFSSACSSSSSPISSSSCSISRSSFSEDRPNRARRATRPAAFSASRYAASWRGSLRRCAAISMSLRASSACRSAAKPAQRVVIFRQGLDSQRHEQILPESLVAYNHSRWVSVAQSDDNAAPGQTITGLRGGSRATVRRQSIASSSSAS